MARSGRAVAPRTSTHGAYYVHVLTNGEFAEHCYLIEHRRTRAAVLVDPGAGTRDAVLALVEHGARVERVLLTHGHFDHVGGVQPVCESLGLDADAHQGDRLLMRQAQLYSIRWEKTLVPIPKRVRYFGGEPRFAWSGGTIETIATPGHTQGSVTYRIGDVAFTGDTVFNRKVGPTLYPGGDRAALLASVERILTVLPPRVTLLAGHGRPWRVEEARAWWADAALAPATFNIFAEQGESAPAGAQLSGMLSEDGIVALMQDCATELYRGKIIDAALDVKADTILLGSDSPLDSMGFVTFVAEVENRINDETGRDLSISLMEVEGLDENDPHMTAGKLAAYIARELAT